MSTNQVYSEWKHYNSVRLSGDKKGANSALKKFINTFNDLDSKTKEELILELVGEYFDSSGFLDNNGSWVSESPIRIQHQFFKEILLPYLIEQSKKQKPKAYKWAAQLCQFFYSDKLATQAYLIALEIDGNFFDREYFLRKSYEISLDPETAKLMLSAMHANLDYATHELPAHMLWDPEPFIEYFEEYLDWSKKANYKSTGKQYDFFLKVYLTCKNFMSVSKDYIEFHDYLRKNKIVLDW